MTTLANEFELISDLYKDARGFRPSTEWIRNFDSKPYAEKVRIWESLQAEVVDSINEDRAREERKLAEFKALLVRTIEAGAGDFATALRWVMDDEVDLEFFLYKQGIESNLGYEVVASWGVGYEYRPGGLYIVRQAA